MKRIPISIEPETDALLSTAATGNMNYIHLMKIFSHYGCCNSWLESKELVSDLEKVAPQVVWVLPNALSEFQAEMAEQNISTTVITEYEASNLQRLSRAKVNSLAKSEFIDLQIRTRDFEMNQEMIEELKSLKLISDYRMGGDANGIFHWKDDRWYQDFHLMVYKRTDIPQIESLIQKHGYIIVN